MKFDKFIISIFTLLVLLVLSGCSGGSSSTSSSSGMLSVLLTDEPGDYRAVYVTINEVQVQKVGTDNNSTGNDSNWIVVAKPYKTYDLLKLQGSVTEELGRTDISIGTYSQMRLILGTKADSGINILGYSHPFANYVVFIGDAVEELYVPSDTIKQTHSFDITENNIITMTIDFNADSSIHYQNSVGRWALSPVISVKTQLEK